MSRTRNFILSELTGFIFHGIGIIKNIVEILSPDHSYNSCFNNGKLALSPAINILQLDLGAGLCTFIVLIKKHYLPLSSSSIAERRDNRTEEKRRDEREEKIKRREVGRIGNKNRPNKDRISYVLSLTRRGPMKALSELSASPMITHVSWTRHDVGLRHTAPIPCGSPPIYCLSSLS